MKRYFYRFINIPIVMFVALFITSCSHTETNTFLNSNTSTPKSTIEKNTVYDSKYPSYTVKNTPTPSIYRNIQGDGVLNIIKPMQNWQLQELEEKDDKFKMIFQDENPQLSIDNFDNYVNNIAGFDVYSASFDSNINVHACQVPEDLSDIDDCFAQFRTKIGKTWYDIRITLGYYDNKQTPRPVEIYVYPRENYSYNAVGEHNWIF